MWRPALGGGAPHIGGALVPRRAQREATCWTPASAKVADSETPFGHTQAPSHACPLQLLIALTPALTLTLTRCASHGCPLQLPTGDHPAPLHLLRERMGTLLQQHASSGCRGVARCAQRGQSALALARSSPLQPPTAPAAHPLCSGLPSGPERREERRGLLAWVPKRGCGGALVKYVRPRRRSHRLWPCRCRLPFAGESKVLLLLGCDTCGKMDMVV